MYNFNQVFLNTIHDGFVIDILLPGYSNDSVMVFKSYINNNEVFQLKVNALFKNDLKKEGFYNYINKKYEYVKLFETKSDYNFEDISWNMENGLLRIFIPKKFQCLDTPVFPENSLTLEQKINGTFKKSGTDS